MWATVEQILARGLSDILWSLLADESYDDHGIGIAGTVDDELHSILQMGWDRKP